MSPCTGAPGTAIALPCPGTRSSCGMSGRSAHEEPEVDATLARAVEVSAHSHRLRPDRGRRELVLLPEDARHLEGRPARGLLHVEGARVPREVPAHADADRVAREGLAEERC